MSTDTGKHDEGSEQPTGQAGGASGFGFRAPERLVLRRGRSDPAPAWDALEVRPFGPLETSPAAAFASYGLGVFEGLKLYRTQSGGAALFRPADHGARFASSAERLCLLPLPPEDFVEMVETAARESLADLPAEPGSALYLRPLLLADEPMLGLRPPSQFLAFVYTSPVGEVLAEPRGLRLRLLDQARVVPGGSGAAKAVGNYAAGLRIKMRWTGEGYDEVLFRDGREPDHLAETSGSNLFLRLRDGRLITPALSDQILPGITRDSVIRLARERLGLTVEERAVGVEETFAEAEEAFVTGTGWGVRAVERLEGPSGSKRFPATATSQRLAALLREIRLGREPASDGWVREIRTA